MGEGTTVAGKEIQKCAGQVLSGFNPPLAEQPKYIRAPANLAPFDHARIGIKQKGGTLSVRDIPREIRWSDPTPLGEYVRCPKGPGCYVIGEPTDPSRLITPATQFDDYMGWWPSNFRGLYIGISLSQREGIRGRLRAHARGRGCRGVREKLQSGANLFFLFIPGLAATNLEAVYVHMKQDEIFPLNTRSELRRQTKRFWAAHEEADRAAGREIVNFGELPGYFEDG